MQNHRKHNKSLFNCMLAAFVVSGITVVDPVWLKSDNLLAKMKEGHFVTAEFGKPIKKSSKNTKQFIDKNDYYLLANGDKKFFFRNKDHYVLFYEQNNLKKTNVQREERLGYQLRMMFPGKAQVVKRHSMGNETVVKVQESTEDNSTAYSLQTLDSNISFVSPLLTNKNGTAELAVLPKLIVRFNELSDYNDAVNQLILHYPVLLVEKMKFIDREYEFKINRELIDISEIFELARSIVTEKDVEWTEPVFLTSPVKLFTPNDTLFNQQWHLHNTGQNGALTDADVDAPEGWNVSKGDGTVIAVFDDGVQLDHPDIVIYNNPGETGGGKESNGIDDDGNGLVDDYQGWDFDNDDNDPSPASLNDNHGTPVAGVAAARGNNSLGVTGSAPNAKIFSVRSGNMSCTDWGNAMRYAAKYSDVVNNSWHIDACVNALNSAIADAVNGNIPGARRGAKGTPVLFATGNSASGWMKVSVPVSSAGIHTFRWEFAKNSSVSAGYDTVWLDDIVWPGGGVTDFENDTLSTIPNGFTSGGNAQWRTVNDGKHSRGATGKSVKAGNINNSQTTFLETSRNVGAGNVTFWVWVSSEKDRDFFKFYINGSEITSVRYSSGQYGHQNSVSYPASNPILSPLARRMTAARAGWKNVHSTVSSVLKLMLWLRVMVVIGELRQRIALALTAIILHRERVEIIPIHLEELLPPPLWSPGLSLIYLPIHLH
ncbi:MAG: hypothetical protein D3924_07085 [Candidatus Electrothrix sp. AR4]|nr:hypothetical protein [Candidatus Electrothrix sp. AR4]